MILLADITMIYETASTMTENILVTCAGGLTSQLRIQFINKNTIMIKWAESSDLQKKTTGYTQG